jgi:hypothetical protein
MALTDITPVVTAEVPKQRQTKGREYGPNLFLAPHPEAGAPEGWLAKSFDDGNWYELTVQGHFEEGTVNKGVNKGKPVSRVVGDAQEVTRQLREAAAHLGVGVSIKYFPVTNKNGSEAKDRLTVKYLGTNRKQRREAAAE